MSTKRRLFYFGCAVLALVMMAAGNLEAQQACEFWPNDFPKASERWYSANCFTICRCNDPSIPISQCPDAIKTCRPSGYANQCRWDFTLQIFDQVFTAADRRIKRPVMELKEEPPPFTGPVATWHRYNPTTGKRGCWTRRVCPLGPVEVCK